MLPETIGRWSIRHIATNANKSSGMTQKSIGIVESRGTSFDVIKEKTICYCFAGQIRLRILETWNACSFQGTSFRIKESNDAGLL